MAQARKRQVDLNGDVIDMADEADPPAPVYGRMTITWYDHGRGAVTPEITFSPLGKLNPNILERVLPYVYREMQRAQVQARKEGPALPGLTSPTMMETVNE